MVGRTGWMLWGLSCLALLLAGFAVPLPANAQGFVNAVPSQARVFPEINSGVTAMKCDSAGRYYILAAPPNVIWVFDRDGKKIGQIPRADAAIGKIQYAVDFDLDSKGRVLVADRATNAVEIFSPEGSLLSTVPVFAPTGVVALPDDQFAVSSLRPKRLVEIRTDQGKLVRSFGDPADAGADPDSKQLQSIGRIFGDGTGGIYFAFTALPDPTVRKYDRFGYAAADATFDVSRYLPTSAPTQDDRVQFGLNYRETSFSDSYNSWVAIGNTGDIFFGGGLSPGLGAHTGEGPATAQTVSSSILSTGLASGPGGGGPGGAAGGGMLSAQGSIQGDSVQLHVGGRPQRANAKANSPGSNSADGKSDSTKSGKDLGEGAALQYNAQESSGDLSSGENIDDSSLPPPPGAQGQYEGPSGRGMMGGLGGFGGIGIFGGLGFGQGFFSGQGGYGQPGGASLGERHGAGGAHGEFSHGPGEGHYGGPHGHFGQGIYNLTASVKVNLDQIANAGDDKPVITALGVDPASKEIWAAIGKVLAHFDKNGDFLGDCFIATPDGALLRASAIIVEPDRIIVASDSHGIYEFARAGRSAVHSSAAGSAITAQPTQQPPSHQ
ncbi:MAG: hypothetical protein WB780_16150 [Candidatus Acidiferrales bacterium]